MDLNIGLSAAQVIIGLIGLVLSAGAATIVIRKFSHRQVQKTGENSINIQAGGNVDMNGSDMRNGR